MQVPRILGLWLRGEAEIVADWPTGGHMGLASCAAAFPRRYSNQVQIIPLQVQLKRFTFLFLWTWGQWLTNVK